MPFMNEAEAYMFRKPITMHFQKEVLGSRESSTFTFDYDMLTMYTHVHTPMGGFQIGQLNAVGVPTTPSNKSQISWMNQYMMQNHIRTRTKEQKNPDIMNIPDGDISGLVKLHDTVLSTMRGTIQLWELMLSVFGREIAIDSTNAQNYNRQQEYFEINGKRYSVQYTTHSFIISEQKNSPESQFEVYKPTRVIELMHPQSHSNKHSCVYSVNRWSFERDPTLGTEVFAADPYGQNQQIPVLEASDTEAYLFQESLVHERMNTSLAKCLGSSCENALPYNFYKIRMQLDYLELSEDNDNFSVVLPLILEEQRARMREYKESNNALSHSLRVRSKFG